MPNAAAMLGNAVTWLKLCGAIVSDQAAPGRARYDVLGSAVGKVSTPDQGIAFPGKKLLSGESHFLSLLVQGIQIALMIRVVFRHTLVLPLK